MNAAAYAEGRAAAGAEDRAALFFDVDGTLLWTDFDNMPESGDFNDILPDVEVYEAFEELNRRGHLTFLCTGRPLSLVNSRLLDLGFSGVHFRCWVVRLVWGQDRVRERLGFRCDDGAGAYAARCGCDRDV